jgi:hypothetical protein
MRFGQITPACMSFHMIGDGAGFYQERYLADQAQCGVFTAVSRRIEVQVASSRIVR